MNYKGQLEGFPQEVVEKMLDYQEEQGNKRDVSVFEKDKCSNKPDGGFNWVATEEREEDYEFWCDVIHDKNFAKFFKLYPKTEQSVPSKTEEQEQEAIPEPTQEDDAMNELVQEPKQDIAELDLTKILKDVPKGTKLYSPIYGGVEFQHVDLTAEIYSIVVKKYDTNYPFSFAKNGFFDITWHDAECMLFPSKENRDWSTFKVDYPIDTPVLCSRDEKTWLLRFYAGNGDVFCDGRNSNETGDTISFKQTIPVTEFDFINRCKKQS